MSDKIIIADISDELAGKYLEIINKLQWKPKINTWPEIKQSQFFKINKYERKQREIN